MIFHRTPLAGAWVIELELRADERGWFARTYDPAEFAAHGLPTGVMQCNASFNSRRDTLRGLHYQSEPHGEPKLIRCVRGAVWDVAVDLRPGSPTYCHWHAVQLSAERPSMFFISPGMAHGFQTLEDASEVLYQMGHPFVPDAARGVRWDDPAFSIQWPAPAGQRIISDRDATYADFQP